MNVRFSCCGLFVIFLVSKNMSSIPIRVNVRSTIEAFENEYLILFNVKQLNV